MQKVERQNSFIYFVGQIYASCGHFSLLLANSGTFGQLLPTSVHLFALLDFGTGCIANIVFSFSGCQFAHLALFSWLFNIQVLLRQNGFCQHHLKYRGYCNYGGGDNYKRALIPRRSPTRRRANCARKWISPWCRKSYHVSLSNETNIQRKPKMKIYLNYNNCKFYVMDLNKRTFFLSWNHSFRASVEKGEFISVWVSFGFCSIFIFAA